MTTSKYRTLLSAARFLTTAAVFSVPVSHAGIFAPAAGEPNSTAVSAADNSIESWATGYENYLPGPDVAAEFQTPERSIGVAGNSDGTGTGVTFDIVSLGDGGSITLKFNPPIKNGPGFDFAVFENSFSDTFLELAKVEVSTNGTDFVPFPAFSLVPGPVGGFGSVDPTDIEQIAGKYRGGFGTPFDLEQLTGSSELNLNRIRFVRLNDIVGDGAGVDGSDVNDLTVASLEQWLGATLPPSLATLVNQAPAVIYDPFPTSGSVGFDLDAIAVLNAGPRQVQIDADIWSETNEINPDSAGQTTLAVYTSSVADGDGLDFDAAEVNSASLRLGFGDAEPVAGPFDFDVDGDGDLDKGWQFNIQDIDLMCGDTFVRLDGETNTGEAFWGRDSITTVDCETSGCHP